jgi:hypothetical protein
MPLNDVAINPRPISALATRAESDGEPDSMLSIQHSRTEHTEVQPANIATAITLVVLVVGLWCFTKAEGTFTDSI